MQLQLQRKKPVPIRRKPGRVLVMVSGFAGSGKSTLADNIGRELGLRVVHASSLLREMKEKGISVLQSNEDPEKIRDWWESEEAKEFMEKRKEDPSLDIALDKKLLEIAQAGNVVLDSWTMPYLYTGKAFRIWLEASAETRARRVADRDALNYPEVLEKVRMRDEETKALYKRLYNFEMGKNLGQFDLVLFTDNMTQAQVLAKALEKLKAV